MYLGNVISVSLQTRDIDVHEWEFKVLSPPSQSALFRRGKRILRAEQLFQARTKLGIQFRYKENARLWKENHQFKRLKIGYSEEVILRES